ncbi:unnamed protein product [Chrysodeixis includens]|uniref:Uncharacterized protein n=1 Tax=Chrysodeixis includens TaxID=689277 RepID=A0A9P0BJY3_CHRIL|nr:unnamed protein product [Chrysodeixis includens]
MCQLSLPLGKMEVNKYLKKLKLLLEYVIEGKVALNQRNVEKLLDFLEDQSDNSPGKYLMATPVFSDVICALIQNLPNATTAVKVFFTEIITIIFKNEMQFNKLQMQGFRSTAIKHCILDNMDTNLDIPCPVLQLTCIKMAAAQISHCSGVQLLLENKVWRPILHPKIHQKPVRIAQAAYKFVSQLICKLNSCDMETELIEVLEYVVKPITTSGYLELEVIDPKTDELLSEDIKTYLNALLVILIDTGDAENNHIANLLRSYFLIDHVLFNIIIATRFTSMITLLNDIGFRLNYASTRKMLFSNKADEFCNEMSVYYNNVISQCIKKREVRAITDFSVKCIIFWVNFEKTYKNNSPIKFPLTFERNGQKFELPNQLIVHMSEPLLAYSYFNQPPNRENTFEQFVDDFILKVSKTVTDHIIASCYLMKTLLQGSDLKKVAIETTKELFRLKGYLSTSQAGIVFQSLYHALNVYIVSDGEGRLILNENPIQCSNDEKLLTLILDLIRMLLIEHNISWYENVEIVSLQEGLMNLLKLNILNSKQIVKSLDLIDICVKKFLSPNMSLLVESQQDSTLNEIGALMKTYLQHDEWEVKDSALNLLCSCTEICFIKYIPLQKVIRENDLMFFAANMALADPEFYVQTMGLKCLAATTKIESIWREVVHRYPHINLHLVYILRNNPEGMVRTEAARVLTGIYSNQKVDENFQKQLYEVMLTAALNDLHSEVQSAALVFWNKVIQKQLAYRGMFDGKFPSVTFSKEKRKIITLNDQEIERQLTSIMNDLSAAGCLTVLLECMNEVNDIEIMQHAYCMSKKLIGILDTYKFRINVDNPATTTLPAEEIKQEEDVAMDLTYSASSDELRNKVIDGILKTYDSDLIIEMHDNYSLIKSNIEENLSRNFVPRKRMVKPKKFIETFRNTDYVTKINDKKQWNSEVFSSLDVLLDEMLDPSKS